MLNASNLGCPVTLHNPTSAAAKAYADAAKRLLGETVEMTTPAVGEQGLIGRLFGRKAMA